MGVLEQYFIDPIVQHSGYNPVNTVTYALLALVALFVLFKKLRALHKYDEEFLALVALFAVVGATCRAVTDLSEHVSLGVFDGVYSYSFWTVSPGIYVVVALFFVFTLWLKTRWGWKALALPFLIIFLNLALILPHVQHHFLVIMVLLLTVVPFLIAVRVFSLPLAWGVFAHALDGAATFVALDLAPLFSGISYREQHVVANAISDTFGGFWAFYVIKVLVAFVVVWLLRKESREERLFYLSVVVLLGLAPGLRDLLRMWMGV